MSRTEYEHGRKGEANMGESDSRFGAMILEEARRRYGEDYDFTHCLIERSSEGNVVTFNSDRDTPVSKVRLKRASDAEYQALRTVIKSVLYDEYREIGEEKVSFIAEDVLFTLGMGILK